MQLRFDGEVSELCAQALEEAKTNPLWTRALEPLLPIDLPPIGSFEDEVVCDIDLAEAAVARNGFTDGSGLEPTNPRIRRCGWSAAIVTENGDSLKHGYGPLPLWVQTVPVAEMFAVPDSSMDVVR